MPLFFFFSGFFFVVGKYAFKDFAMRRLRTLYVPFVIWSLLFLALHGVLVAGGISEGDVYDLHRYKLLVYKIFVEMKQFEPLGGTFWFFPQLLAVNVIGFAYLNVSERMKGSACTRHQAFVVALPLLLATFMAAFDVKFYVGQISYITLLGLFFFVCGHYLHGAPLIGRKQCIVALIVIVLSGWTHREMIDLGYMDIIPYALVAIAGIILVYNISKRLAVAGRVGEIFDYSGRHSLSIMILHFAAFKLVSATMVATGCAPFAQLSSHPVIGDASWAWRTVYSVVGVAVPLALNEAYSCIKARIQNR